MRLLGFAALFVSAGTHLPGQDAAVTGQYIEDRSARVYACACEWSDESANHGREAVLAWNIKAGEYRGEKLAGVRLAAVVVGDYLLSEPQSARRSTLFVDPGAAPAQRRAGLLWLRSRFAEVLGTVLGEHEMTVDFRQETDSISLRVGDVLVISMRPTRLAEDTEVWARLIYDPLITLETSHLGTTSRAEYSGPDLKAAWTRVGDAITGYYGTFAIE